MVLSVLQKTITEKKKKCNDMFIGHLSRHPDKLLRCQKAFANTKHTQLSTATKVNMFRSMRKGTAADKYNKRANNIINRSIKNKVYGESARKWLIGCKACGKSFHTYASKHTTCYFKQASRWKGEQIHKKNVRYANRRALANKRALVAQSLAESLAESDNLNPRRGGTVTVFKK